MASKSSKTNIDNDSNVSSIHGSKTTNKMSATSNTIEPQQRVINRIVTLDAKKLKDLGIESNILSALTKFNVKDKAVLTKESIKIGHDSATTSNATTNATTTFKLSTPTKQHQTIEINSIQSTVDRVDRKTESCVSTPKVRILSDVIIRSPGRPSTPTSTTASNQQNLSSISQTVDGNLSQSQPEIVPPDVNKNNKTSITKRMSPNKSIEVPTQKTHIEELLAIEEIESWLGFTSNELKCAISQLSDLENGFNPKAIENPKIPKPGSSNNEVTQQHTSSLNYNEMQAESSRSRHPKKRMRHSLVSNAAEDKSNENSSNCDFLTNNTTSEVTNVETPDSTAERNITGNQQNREEIVIQVFTEPATSTPKRKGSAVQNINRKRKKSILITEDFIDEEVREPNTTDLEVTGRSNIEDKPNPVPSKKDDGIGEQSPQGKPRRGRKSKQTVMNDFFSVSSAESKSVERKAEPMMEGVAESKISRSGRVIKPKSSDFEWETRRKSHRTSQSETKEDVEMTEKVEEQKKDDPLPEAPRKRGRKARNIAKTEEIVGISEFNESVPRYVNETETQITSVDETVIVASTSSSDANNSQTEVSTTEPETNKPKRRGRPSKKMLEVAAIQRIKEEDVEIAREIPEEERIEIEKKRELEEKITIAKQFVCGNCKENVTKAKWKAHVAIHYGVTWREEIDEPIDVDDQATANRMMIKFMKLTKLQFFRCPKCSEKKKSALGYLSHVDFCGLTADEMKTAKAECPHCKKLYKKVSLPSHIQGFCPVRRMEIEQKKAEESLNEEYNVTIDEVPEDVVYTESGRLKRIIKKVKAPSKAVDEFIKIGLKVTGGVIKVWNGQLLENGIIKCPNTVCTFLAKEIEEMRLHFTECKEKIHQCKLCSVVFHDKQSIIDHIEKEHEDVLKVDSEPEDDTLNDTDFKGVDFPTSDDDDSPEYDEDDSSERKPYRRRSMPGKPGKRRRSIALERFMETDSPEYWEMLETFYERILTTKCGLYRISYQWTKNFTEQHYDQNALECKNHIRETVNYVRLTSREIAKYLNSLEAESMKFACQKQTVYEIPRPDVNNFEWKSLSLFESTNEMHLKNETSILFCGGKITYVDWIPFPSDYKGNQILVICSQNKDAKLISPTNCQVSERASVLIQLWSIITKSESENDMEKAEFLYGIAYEDGPIAAMSFCPSDAYIPLKRLAIVAIPDTNGSVNIISLPETISKGKSNTMNVIKLIPEIRLQLNFEMNELRQQTITQLTWSRTKGHKILCAGYNTGYIAVWNFEHLNSSYMQRRIDDIPVILPKHSFLGALSCITQMDLHSDKDHNARWLLIGAMDRKIRLYDLEDPTLTPFTSTLYKSRIMSGVWPIHWPVYLTLIDAALTRLGGGIHIKEVLYTNNQSQNTNLSNDAEPSNLAFSDWLNTAIFGNDVGDLFMMKFDQLLLHDRASECSTLTVLSVADVPSKGQTETTENTETIETIESTVPTEPNECTIDQKLPSEGTTNHIVFTDYDETLYAPKLETRMTPLEVFPFYKINRVAINPNESHKHMYAIGYELGLCRIRFIP